MPAFSKLLGYTFAILLSKPFKDWDAYKLGVINEKGELLKDPSTPEEKKSLGLLEDFVRKIKRIIVKFVPDNRLLQFLVSAYILREDKQTEEVKQFICEMDQIMLANEKEMLYNLLNTVKNFK